MNLNTICTRKHPEYARHERAWRHALDAYGGGAQYIAKALVKHVTEMPEEYSERLARASYSNYPRKIARLITQYALSSEPVREDADPDIVEDFSRTGLRANEVMRQCSTILNVCGAAWLYVGMPGFDGDADMERVQRERLRPFVQTLSPLEVVDWCIAADGRLLWAIIERTELCNEDPFATAQVVKTRLLWTRREWICCKVGGATPAASATTTQGVNPLGVVPLIRITEPDGFGIEANHWFEDVVRISDAILNNQSEAQMNIIKQMFGLLVVSETFARSAGKVRKPPEGEGAAKGGDASLAAVISRSVAVIETAEDKGISRYIAPSGVENTTIQAENDSLRHEMYDTVGLAIQSSSKSAQTAESKSWDFNNVAQFLATRADMLEQAEKRAWELLNKWDAAIAVPLVTYNRKFAVVDFAAAASAIMSLASLPNVGVEYQKQVARTGLELLEQVTPVSDDAKAAILEEIDNMEVAPLPDLSFGAPDDDDDD